MESARNEQLKAPITVLCYFISNEIGHVTWFTKNHWGDPILQNKSVQLQTTQYTPQVEYQVGDI